MIICRVTCVHAFLCVSVSVFLCSVLVSASRSIPQGTTSELAFLLHSFVLFSCGALCMSARIFMAGPHA